MFRKDFLGCLLGLCEKRGFLCFGFFRFLEEVGFVGFWVRKYFNMRKFLEGWVFLENVDEIFCFYGKI